MIEDKSIGLKITENEDETMWNFEKKALEDEIKNLEKQLKINKVFLEKTNEILKQFTTTEVNLKAENKTKKTNSKVTTK